MNKTFWWTLGFPLIAAGVACFVFGLYIGLELGGYEANSLAAARRWETVAHNWESVANKFESTNKRNEESLNRCLDGWNGLIKSVNRYADKLEKGAQ